MKEFRGFALLELLAIVMAVEIWAPQLCGRQVQLRSDNESTVFMLNAKTSKKEENMSLIRHLTLTCMSFQIHVTARHESGQRNFFVDSLSRGLPEKFLKLVPWQTKSTPTPPPTTLWPMMWSRLRNLN